MDMNENDDITDTTNLTIVIRGINTALHVLI
jgi:hypothetical protein